jgi:hypothetical protein
MPATRAPRNPPLPGLHLDSRFDGVLDWRSVPEASLAPAIDKARQIADRGHKAIKRLGF